MRLRSRDGPGGDIEVYITQIIVFSDDRIHASSCINLPANPRICLRPWRRSMYNSPRFKAITDAGVAELVDALDLGSSAARRESSSLFPRTTDESKSYARLPWLAPDSLHRHHAASSKDALTRTRTSSNAMNTWPPSSFSTRPPSQPGWGATCARSHSRLVAKPFQRSSRLCHSRST